MSKRCCLVLLCLLMIGFLIFSLPVAAQEDQDILQGQYVPVKKIDLGVSSLTLEVGETYIFTVTYEPAEPLFKELYWQVSDSSVIQIDSENYSVTALAAGTSRILAESFDGNASMICDVTVNGDVTKDAIEIISGTDSLYLSDADLAKITSSSINEYFKFINGASFDAVSMAKAKQREFVVSANVKPGTESVESQRALSLGMADATPLYNLNVVTLQGTIEQIVAFAGDNEDLIQVFEIEKAYILDPIYDDFSSESVEKAMNLKGSTEGLTNISVARSLGMTGSGTTVAILDTGMNPGHEQFSGRVVAQACYGTSYTSGSTIYRNVCSSSTSAIPSGAKNKTEFNHGSHVAGIAAGRDGIAPKAKIVAVQGFTEVCNSSYCYGSTLFGNDQLKAYDFLLGLVNKGTKITAVNMSFGTDDAYTKACDDEYAYYYSYFLKLINAGIIPVAASGNEYYNNGIAWPACYSNVFTVGALADNSTPKIANFSNHSKLVDMLAPGSNIWSAFYVYESGTSATCSGINCYGYYSGTSMATPMVTGAFALLKQMYPNKSVAQYETLIKTMTSKTSKVKASGTSFSYSKPVLNFSKLATYFAINSNDRIRGYNHGIRIEIDRFNGNATYDVKVTNMKTGKVVSPTMKVDNTSNPKYTIIRLSGTNTMVNGVTYKLEITRTVKINGKSYKSNVVTKYGMPSNRVVGITATPGDEKVTLNAKYLKTSDGTRYNIYDATSGRMIETANKSGNNTVWNVTGLANGWLYYAVAFPYNNVNGSKAWGPTDKKIYFIPMSKPSGAKVSWSSDSTANVSMDYDYKATGIRVLYRVVGGALQQGCESTGSSCSISGLNSSTAYEFYVMKYKRASTGKNHYGSGTVVTYNTTGSGLSAPTKPYVFVSDGGTATVSVSLGSGAQGISVLYRKGEGDFVKLCEAKGSSCKQAIDWSAKGINKNNKFSFFVMQYKTVNGKKVYSPGVFVNNFLSPKDGNGGIAYTEGAWEEEFETSVLYNALKDYYTDEDILQEEAFALMNVDGYSELESEAYDDELEDDDDYFVDDSWVFDAEVDLIDNGMNKSNEDLNANDLNAVFSGAQSYDDMTIFLLENNKDSSPVPNFSPNSN